MKSKKRPKTPQSHNERLRPLSFNGLSLENALNGAMKVDYNKKKLKKTKKKQ